ncbi:transposase [bacterium]|nr:transposase [bacterium]
MQRERRKNNNTVLLKKFSSSFTPLDAVKIYKKRHHIENEGFRELKDGYKINRFPSRKFSGVYFHIIFTLLIYNFINCFKTEKGNELAGIGLVRLDDKSWYGVVIYAYPHFGIFEIKEIAEWFGYKGKGQSAPFLIF